MHPEELANELAAKAEAEKTIGAFFETHQKAFMALIQTYSDAEAADLLAEMREKFWAATPAGSDLSPLSVERQSKGKP